jgi:addiction module RelE/StbE family toxin
VRRLLLRSAAFVRAARRAVKKWPQAAGDVQETLELLSADAWHPRLKTHKLQGGFDGYWACSASYDLRIVFRFVQHESQESILLETVGTHEEVY